MGIWENRNKLGNPKIEKKKIQRETLTHTKRKNDTKKMSIMQTHTDQPIIRHGGMRIFDIRFDSVVFISFVTVFRELVFFFCSRYCDIARIASKREMYIYPKRCMF